MHYTVFEKGGNIYRTRAIITRSRFETALDYKPRIFKVRKVSMNYKPLCNINRGLYIYKKPRKILIVIIAAKVFLFDRFAASILLSTYTMQQELVNQKLCNTVVVFRAFKFVSEMAQIMP